MNICYIPIGCAGSGKTTYLDKLRRNSKDLIAHISSDRIRFDMLDYDSTKMTFNPDIESEVWRRYYSNLEWHCEMRHNVYCDSTNILASLRKKICEIVLSYNYSIHFIWFRLPLNEILLRNKTRDRQVEDFVIEKQFGIAEPLTYQEEKAYKITIINK